MKMYELTQGGKEIERAFLADEIDEETLNDTREMLEIELTDKSSSLIYIYNNFVNFLGKGTGANKIEGTIDLEIARLKKLKELYKSRFDKFNKMVVETMLAIGIESGQSNGIKTSVGILFLRKSTKTIKPNPEEVLDRYKEYKTKEAKFTFEEFQNLPEWVQKKLEIKSIEVNKELYETEQTAFKKETNYSLNVK